MEGLSLAKADCEYKAPLPPRLARPFSMVASAQRRVNEPGDYRRDRIGRRVIVMISLCGLRVLRGRFFVSGPS